MPIQTPAPDALGNEIENSLNRLRRSRGFSDEDIRAREQEQRQRETSLRAHEIMNQAGLPERAREFTRGGIVPKEFAALSMKLGGGVLAAIIGARGTGKTCAAVAMIRMSAERGESARYVKAMDIFLSVRETFRKDSTKSEAAAIASFVLPRLLVIDEMQERGETKWEDRLLTYVIDKRYDAKKDTILIANLKAAELAEQLGPSVTSRLREAGGVVECNWGSFRG